MSSYVELWIEGGHRALIEAGSVVGVLMSGNMEAVDIAKPDAPIRILLRGGEFIDGVYGLSAEELLWRCAAIRLLHKESINPAITWYLDEDEDQRLKDAVGRLLASRMGHGRTS